ncbi:uncharacterized protein K460DRAFT_419968 [Cucurbitaria berberidis CBS 394.84]|uniref:Uncharacterized protein n=1 Tax=Cucurbitaria berberidis CBS 394.84 TaxID=1168544 RepID=A0A9P4GAT2_9PLEO|nr:uncharacterized protein K460DRAFT_419968 [Cucurbitaria berberidis CBS 394.84]KAF1841991.1 hypothetical protein K460DRAFT_419968 [Cucurbitaria berberidis CBS 394.84]
MATPTRPQASPRISTLRRKGNELFAVASHASANPFDPDESEFEFVASLSPTRIQHGDPSKSTRGSPVRELRTSPLKSQATGGAVKTEAECTTEASISGLRTPNGKSYKLHMPSTPTSSPRPSTLKRVGNELLGEIPYSSSNPFEPDDFEFGELSPTRTMRRGNLSSLRSPPVASARTSPLRSTLRTRMPRSASLQKDDTVEPFTPVGSPLEATQPSTPTPSPRISTLRRAGADFFAEEGYASNPWDPDCDEFSDGIDGLSSSPTKAIRGNPLRSRRGSPIKSSRKSPLRPVFDSPPKSEPNTASILSPGKGVNCHAKSMWDADDDEFDRWPGKETMNRVTKHFMVQRDQLKNTTHVTLPRSTTYKTSEEIDEIPPICGANLTLQEHDDMMHELADMNCGNPYGSDVHDEVMRQFWSRSHASLPTSFPARYPHLLNVNAYKESNDLIIKSAYPRLCDAVVTILQLTTPKCLVDFLDPNVKVFEWRRNGNCLMIRREGNEVIVGTYHNFGTRYVWTYFVRSSISYTGEWTEVYAAATQGSTPVSDTGVQFDKFEAEQNSLGIDSTDAKFALYVGRGLAWFLLKWEVWNYRYWRQYKVEWEVDGVVTNAREYDRYQLIGREEDD